MDLSFNPIEVKSRMIVSRIGSSNVDLPILIDRSEFHMTVALQKTREWVTVEVCFPYWRNDEFEGFSK